MISLKITKKNNGLHIGQQGKITANDAITLSFELLRSIILQTFGNNRFSKEVRRAVYNYLVQEISELANQIYPEIEEEKGSPEDFLAYLEKKCEEARANVQQTT